LNWLPELVLLLVTTGAGIWAAGRWLDPCGDASFAWSEAYRIAKGERLYRDLYLPYMPLSGYLLAGWLRLFGGSTRSFLLASWIPAVLAGCLLVRYSRLFLSTLERLVLVGVLLGTSLLVNGTGRLVLPYHSAIVHALAFSVGALLLVRTETERLKTRALLAGLSAGLAFACKQEIGVAALIALGVAALAGMARPATWLTRLLAGFLLVLLPLAIFVLSSAPIESLRHDSHLWPLASPPSTTLHLMRGAAGFARADWPRAARMTILLDLTRIVLLALAALALAREHTRAAWLRVATLLAGLGVWWLLEGHSRPRPLPSLSLSLSVAFLVAVLALLWRDLPHRPALAALATFATLVAIRTAVATNLAGHYGGPGHFATALTSVLFLIVLMPRLLLGETRAARYLRVLMVLVLLAVGWRQTAEGVQSLHFMGVPVETREGRVFTDDGHARVLTAIARDSHENESVLPLPSTYGIDALFRLRSVSPLIEALPGWLSADVERRLLARLAKSPPDLVVLFERSFKHYGAGPFGVGYGLMLSDWISSNYRVVESFPAGKVLRRRWTVAQESGRSSAFRGPEAQP
jgi:hypothetical protein